MLDWEDRNDSDLVAGYAEHPHGWPRYVLARLPDGRVRVGEYKVDGGGVWELQRSATVGSVEDAKDQARIWAAAFEATPAEEAVLASR